jgi:hypothetical protein
LNAINQKEFDRRKLRALLLLRSLTLRNGQTKAAGMLTVESVQNPTLNSFGLGVIYQHTEPGSGL